MGSSCTHAPNQPHISPPTAKNRSLLTDEFTGWYSWALSTLTSAVYTFGCVCGFVRVFFGGGGGRICRSLLLPSVAVAWA